MSFEEFFRAATNSPPFQYQTELAAAPMADRVLKVPTGGGKTAAYVLAWLWKHYQAVPNTPVRLVIVLPMRSLVRQTCRNILDWVEALKMQDRIPIVELRGDVDDLRKRQREWVLYPELPAILVGTVDLLLSAALNRGYAMSRFRWPVAFGLLNNSALWVVDEVQLMGAAAANISQLARFRSIFGTFGDVHTWWVSATVEPSWLRTVDNTAEPVVFPEDRKRLHRELDRRYTATKTLRALRELNANSILDLHRPRSLTIIVANTVARAQNLYRQLMEYKPAGRKGRATTPVPKIRLLHSRYRPGDRSETSDILFAADKAYRNGTAAAEDPGLILVATQVVEAGLDISARTLITELAPWPSLVQRFGRLNRFGEYSDAIAACVDVKTADSAPYDPKSLSQARDRIRTLGEVSPSALDKADMPQPEKAEWVLRLHDLHGLFSTEKDLAGGFTDISVFVRDSVDTDVYFFWRSLAKGGPNSGEQQSEPEPAELCSVQLHEAREFARSARLYEWNDELGRWEQRRSADIVPGMVLLCDVRDGGYSALLGWTGKTSDRPVPARSETPANSDRGDPDSAGSWCELDRHLTATADAAKSIVASLGLAPDIAAAVEMAARWHDIGKAHPDWQVAACRAILRSKQQWREGVWAKFPARRNTFRPGFRHEEASALWAFDQWRKGVTGWTELAVYLVAAHHGKIRTALGVHGAKRLPQGDLLLPGWIDSPASIDLDLVAFAPSASPIADGRQLQVSSPGWNSVIEHVLGPEEGFQSSKALGPFRLAFIEAVMAAADARASRSTEVAHA